MLKRLIIVVVAMFFVIGCAANRTKLTRQQWLDLTSKTYSDVTKNQVLLAAEKLFELADGDDFIVVHTESGLQATRNWTAYIVVAAARGTDYWKVDAEDVDGDIKVTVQVNTQSQSVTPIATTSGSWTTTTTPMAGSPVMGTAIYDVFWARMDYLLGKRQDWMDCEKADARVKRGETNGTNEALCNSFNIKDDNP